MIFRVIEPFILEDKSKISPIWFLPKTKLSVPGCVGGGLFHGWRIGLRRKLPGVLRDAFQCEAFDCSFFGNL